MSPLYLAILNSNEECAALLLEVGAQTYYNDDDLSKDTSPIFLAIRKEETKILEEIIDFNMDMRAKDSAGLTPLMYAAKHNKQQVVNLLTSRSSDLDEEDANSLTILMHTLKEENLQMARKLINRGANINYVNRNGQTALHICVMQNTFKSIEWLLKQKKIDRHICDLEGNDPCDLAKRDPKLLEQFNEFTDCNPKLKHSQSGTKYVEHMQRTFNADNVIKSQDSSPVADI